MIFQLKMGGGLFWYTPNLHIIHKKFAFLKKIYYICKLKYKKYDLRTIYKKYI